MRDLVKTQQIMLNRAQIQQKIRELADELCRDYKNRLPVMLCVLNGSVLFFVDLIREMQIDLEIDFVKISSYGNSMKTSGEVKILKPPDCHLKGRDVIIVEDIIDSGLSVNFLRNWIAKFQPRSLACISLLVKDEAAVVTYDCEYVGFHIPNAFVVGYGLDYAQKYRNLPDIYVLDPEFVGET